MKVVHKSSLVGTISIMTYEMVLRFTLDKLQLLTAISNKHLKHSSSLCFMDLSFAPRYKLHLKLCSQKTPFFMPAMLYLCNHRFHTLYATFHLKTILWLSAVMHFIIYHVFQGLFYHKRKRSRMLLSLITS